jgi:hypothetical protein
MKRASATGLALIIAALLSCNRAMPRSTPGPASNVTVSPSEHKPRSLKFSGYDWTVKSNRGRVGPGPNYFSDSDESVLVDAQGRLHLKITQRDGQWHCAEIVSTRSLGYGTYSFYLDSTVDHLDPQVVLGMFTWNDAPDYNHREIDIEVSRWGRAENQNAQFVIQPYTRSQNILRFQIPPGLPASLHSFTWEPGKVFCQSMKSPNSLPRDGSSVIQQHTFTEGVPQAGGENARINLWLLAGRPPADGKETEVIINKFEFVPWQQRP